jgi:predicted RNA-binding protein
VGNDETWECALKNKLWAFREKNKGLWNATNKNDKLAFYITSPVSKIFGFGKILDKYIDHQILWPEEKLFGASIYPYRLKLEIIYFINNWNNGINVSKTIMLNTGRKLIHDNMFDKLANEAEKKWGKNFRIYLN